MTTRSAVKGTQREFQLTDIEFNRLRELVRRYTGIALSEAKRELVYGRLVKRVRALSLGSFGEYCRLVEGQHPEELQELTNAITTNLTSFFREEYHFQQLAREVLPEREANNTPTRRLRIWSSACSTGEEAYSIAIVLRETLAHLRTWDVRVLATDIDSNVVSKAAQGTYNVDHLKGVSAARRQRWFRPMPGRGECYSAAPELKDLITFKHLNLFDPWPMRGQFDIIFCRNVVIYFDKSTQRKLFERMAEAQEPGGWLFIGHSENLQNVTNRYRLVGRTAYRRI
jgi:chemotaxis protein methyltransferase CheR